MHNYVHWHCSIDYCVKLILIDENLCENYLYFTQKWFLFNYFGGNVLLGGELQIDEKKIIFHFTQSFIGMICRTASENPL